MASTDAIPVPRKASAFRLYFAIRDSSGDLVTSWAGADSEVSKDGGSFADCTNEATEIGTSGCGYLELTSTEMNADSVVVKITVTNTNAKSVVVALYPEESGDYRVDQSSLATASALSTVAGYIDTEVAAIKAKTDNLPSDPADASDIASAFSTVNSALATIAAYIDTEVAAIKTKTDGLPSDTATTLTTIQNYVDTLETEVAKIIKSGESQTISRAGQTSITYTATRV